MVRVLDDKDWTVRREACVVLAELGSDGKQAVPKLIRLLPSDQDSDAVRDALRKINAVVPDRRGMAHTRRWAALPCMVVARPRRRAGSRLG